MSVDVAEAAGRRQERHAVAGLLGPLSLRTRLSLLVGFIVAVVVGAAAFLELRMFTTRMESELIGSARVQFHRRRRMSAAVGGYARRFASLAPIRTWPVSYSRRSFVRVWRHLKCVCRLSSAAEQQARISCKRSRI